MEFPRDAESVECPGCHGFASRVPCDAQELAMYNCGSKTECCARTFKCRICETRIVGTAESPEME